MIFKQPVIFSYETISVVAIVLTIFNIICDAVIRLLVEKLDTVISILETISYSLWNTY